MKNIKYILLIILLIPFNAYAYDLLCPAGPYEYGDTFECYIKGDSSITYDELSGSIELPKATNLTCDIVDPQNGLTKNEVSKGFKFTGKSNTDELVKISCNVSEKPSSSGFEQIIIPDFKYHELDGNKDAFNEILRSSNILLKGYVEQVQEEKNKKPRNTDDPSTRLKSITEPNLDFVFSAFKTEYEISVKYEIDKIDLNIIKNNEAATYEIVGSQDLQIGQNVIDIYVTSPDGVTQTCYTLTINRLKRGEEIYYIEKDSSLSALSIDGYNINFESIIYEYKIHIKYDVNKINVKATATNPAASISISNTDDLKNGSAVTVTVISQDGSETTTYTIKITKDPEPKDYRSTIYIGIFVFAIAVVIIIILRTNLKNKGNPLLKIKKKTEAMKEEAEKHKKLDMNTVPNAVDSNVITPSEPAPVESVETLNTQVPIQPVVPTAPVEPQVPVAPAEPVAPVTPVEVQTPVVPVQPIEVPTPVAPVEPVQQVEMPTPVAPVEPVQPVDVPAPVVPVEPVQPRPAETNIFDQ